VTNLLAGHGSTATSLVSGKILMLGGGRNDATTASAGDFVASGSAYQYEPVPKSTFINGSFGHRGAYAVVGQMLSGDLVFAGGIESRAGGAPSTTASAHTTYYSYYHNVGGGFGDLSVPRAFAAAVVLNGRMIVAGGTDGSNTVHSSADRLEPNTQNWGPGGSMSTPRFRFTMSGLPGDTAIAVGGRNATSCSCTTFLSTVDRFDLYTNTWSPAKPLLTARDSHTATTLPDGRILVVGGYGGTPNSQADTGAPLASAEI
jgi:hypothetical protein